MEIVNNRSEFSEATKSELSKRFTRDRDNLFEQLQQLSSSKIPKKEHKLMRVYVGPSSDTGPMSHIVIFDQAMINLSMVEHGWKIEKLNSAEIRKYKMKEGCSSSWDHPSFLVDWLLESTIHVILCQGIHCGFLELWTITASSTWSIILAFWAARCLGERPLIGNHSKTGSALISLSTLLKISSVVNRSL